MASQASVRNFYEILQVEPSADAAAIQKSYRQLARLVHPDRARTPEHARELTGQFQLIADAYRTLSDAKLRARYDACLENRAAWAKKPPIINEMVDLDEMAEHVDDDGQYSYTHPCRCGHSYDISEVELSQNMDVVACSGCSLHVRVLYQLATDDL